MLGHKREKRVSKVDKVILVRPKGAPTRDSFKPTVEGRELYRAARVKFWDENPMVEKRVQRTSTRYVSRRITLDILKDEARLSVIEKIKNFEQNESGTLKRPTVDSSIALIRSLRKTRVFTIRKRRRPIALDPSILRHLNSNNINREIEAAKNDIKLIASMEKEAA